MCGENLAGGPSDPDRVFTLWMESPTHRAIIFKPGATEIGLGWTQRPGGMENYWVLVVAAPR